MKIILPFVSVLDDQDDCRYPVTLRSKRKPEWNQCEYRDWRTPCSHDDYYLGDEDDNSPVFCFRHFRDLHEGKETKQSHIEPMNAEELTLL